MIADLLNNFEVWFYQKKDWLWELISYNFCEHTLICVTLLFCVIGVIGLIMFVNHTREQFSKFDELEKNWEKEERDGI